MAGKTDTIKCGNCEKDSGILSGANEGGNAARLLHIGWKAKLPILLGISEWLFACSQKCLDELRARKYAEHSVSEDAIENANRVVGEMKSRIPQMTQDVCEKMSRLQKRLRREKKI